MAGKFIPLDEAARMLGVPADRLVDMIKEGQVRGFRDGTSWKFPDAEIERLKDEGLDALDDMVPEGSSVLVSDQDVGSKAGRSGSIIGGDAKDDKSDTGVGSDVGLGGPGDPEGSGLMLIADGDDSGVRLVSTGKTPGPLPRKQDDDDELLLADDAPPVKPKKPAAKPTAKAGSRSSSALSDLDLLPNKAGSSGGALSALSGASHVLGSKTPAIGSAAMIDDSDLAIADDDDLVLGGGGSDLAIAGDSGLNLMSPSDSGLSLEAEPLDLAGSSISALDLGGDSGGSKKKKGSSGSLVDFRADEEFNLSPSGVDMATDDDSGSEVIEVEDSAEAFDGAGFNDGSGAGFDGFEAVPDQGEDGGMEVVEDSMTMDRDESSGMVPAFEVPYSLFNVLSLLLVLLPLCMGGMILTDMVRNLADHDGLTTQVSSLTKAMLGVFGVGE